MPATNKMRLSLRKQLKPYISLEELANDFDMTLPELKRLLRVLETTGDLSLVELSSNRESKEEPQSDSIFQLFHQLDCCLVCGGSMANPQKRDIGWGEFKECRLCGYSAHELATYDNQKKTASSQLKALREQAIKADKILTRRKQNAEELRKKQSLT